MAQLPHLVTMESIMKQSSDSQTHKSHYASQITTPVGYLQVLSNEDAIISVQFADEAIQEHENDVSHLGKQQLIEYFNQKRAHFDLPLAAAGTHFQQQVWSALMDIEYGEVASYLDIAKAIGNEKACRAVGAANGKNPIAIVVPCHRIIGSNGTLTGYAGGMSRKSFLLSLESKQQRIFIENV